MKAGRIAPWLLLALAASALAAGPGPDPVELDLFVISDREFAPGSQACLRVVTRVALGLVESGPAPLSRLEVRLTGQGQRSVQLFSGRTDLLGHRVAVFRVPDWPDGEYTLAVAAKSPLGQAALQRPVQIHRFGRVWLVSDRPAYRSGQTVRLRALVLDQHRLRPLAGERLRVAIRDPQGIPVLDREWATDFHGIASLEFQLADPAVAGPYRIELAPLREQAIEAVFRTVFVDQVPPSDPGGDQLLGPVRAPPPAPSEVGLRLATDRAIYQAGQGVRASIQATGQPGVCFVDLIKDRQMLASHSAVLVEARAELRMALGPEAFGVMVLKAHVLTPDGEVISDARVIYVQPPDELQVSVARDQARYRPGEQVLFRFLVHDRSGRPRPAVLGVAIVDQAARPHQPLAVGQEKVFFTLDEPLRELGGPSGALSGLIRAPQLEPQDQQLARTLLDQALVPPGPPLWSNPVAIRRRKADQDRAAIEVAIWQHCRLQACGERHQGQWRYRPDLVDRLVAADLLREDDLRDPLGQRYRLETIERLWPQLQASQILGAVQLERMWRLRGLMAAELTARVEDLSRLQPDQLQRQLELAFQSAVRRQPDLARDPAGKTHRFGWLCQQPGFRPGDFISLSQFGRVQALYRALSRYGQESQRWYRLDTYDPVADAYRLPQDVVSRLVRRGLLADRDARDFWGQPFLVRPRELARPVLHDDRRLRFIEVYSLGPDGRSDTADDLVYETPHSDRARQELARALGLQADARDQEVIGVAGKSDSPADVAPQRPVEQAPAPPDASLVFVPALATDAQGRAELRVELPQLVTTWRLVVTASAPDGLLGSAGHNLRVFDDVGGLPAGRD